MTAFQNIRYHTERALLWLISLLPLRVLYCLCDIIFPIVYYLVRYRRKVVRQNLQSAFPEKTEAEIVSTEKRFYHFFCDQFAEQIKLFSMSKKQMMRRMQFTGLENIRQAAADGNHFIFVMLGHYGNWEWIASLQYWLPEIHCTQIYHKLENPVSNKIFLELRNQYGGECIKMKDTFRRLLQLRSDERPVVVGFIADQQPKWNAIHHFTPFLHHDTAVFTGAEQLAKKLGAAMLYGHVTNPRRGYYQCEMQPMTTDSKAYEDFQLTDLYFQMLEQDIISLPHIWLWSHKRWSRTKERWLQRQQAAKDDKQ